MHGVERSGKCFCPPFAPQRDRDYKGRGTPFPFCARLLTARLRCTSLWRCAGLPVGIADAQGPLTQGPRGVRLTHVQGRPSNGWPGGALRSGRKGTA